MVAKLFDEIKPDISQRWAGVSESLFLSGKISGTARLEPFVVIEDDVIIGKNTIIGPNTFIRNGTEIGEHSTIGGCCVLEGKGVKVGNYVRIGTHCNLGWGTVIEDCVFVAGHMTGANDDAMIYLREPFSIGDVQSYTIKYGARIGLHVVIGAGVTVGKNSVVGMGSVVTHDVEENSVVYGVPARYQNKVKPEDRL